jgi:type I restriction-modification system DNA methylase subunit
MSVQEQISQLIDKYKYETNKAQSEADVRANYIDWLFSYLGWDVWGEDPEHNTTYHREGYIRGAGYVDVGLEIARQPVLMLEAKRFGTLAPSTERKYDRTPEEKQLFKYARAKKIPYCILTNFECLQVFNADHERLILAFDSPTEYLDRLSELLHLSPERVKAGSLQASERQLELKDIDEEFLASLQGWRLQLANSIYQYNLSNPALQTNGSLDFDKLMAAVQRVLDRLILIRFADDKEVLLTYDVIDSILSNYRKKGGYTRPDDLMRDFIDLSHRMDERHNTTLFQPGHICEQVFIPNDVLEHIMWEMNNISFRKFTSDILGNTYETYLGTKLVLRNGEIESEARRDIRKAGGIFYTPPMIVHYIADNTLDRLLNELEKQFRVHAIEKAKEIKVLDPACGSGSFLTYAYQVLANFYRRMNQQIEDEQVKLLADVASPDMFKRLELLKQLPQPLLDYPHHILQKQLYGVDIDPEAAEIAAVNLTMQAFADARQEKLPLILNENIKVGNSLISGSEQELRHYFCDNWRDKRPFNWEEEFPQIIKNGGFDIVIGNPPWVSLKGKFGVDGISGEEISYLTEKYGGDTYRPNMVEYFIKRSLALLKGGGFHSFVIPDRVFYNLQFEDLRKQILGTCNIHLLVHRVSFPGTTADAAIYVLQKGKPTDYWEMSVCEWGKPLVTVPQVFYLKSVDHAFVALGDRRLATIMEKVEEAVSLPLGKLLNSSVGFIAKQGKVTNKPISQKDMVVYKGENVTRYALKGHFYFNFVKSNLAGGTQDEAKLGVKEKILLRKTGDRIFATIDDTSNFPEQSLYFLYTPQDRRYNLRYVLALLNSQLLGCYYINRLATNRDTMPQLKKIHLDRFPIRHIDFDNPEEKKMHDELVALADRMMELNERLALIGDAPSEESDALNQEIQSIDAEIDQRVYDLYGLTKEERQIIEASFGS